MYVKTNMNEHTDASFPLMRFCLLPADERRIETHHPSRLVTFNTDVEVGKKANVHSNVSVKDVNASLAHSQLKWNDLLQIKRNKNIQSQDINCVVRNFNTIDTNELWQRMWNSYKSHRSFVRQDF